MTQIYDLIPKIMADIAPIEKTKRNEQQGYFFRGIDDLYAALQPALIKHGVFYVCNVAHMEREERPRDPKGILINTILTVDYVFFAPDGSSIACRTIGEGMDTGDKSTSKAMSSALKYCLLQLFCIPTAELKDIEHESPEPLTHKKSITTNNKPKSPPLSDSAFCPQCSAVGTLNNSQYGKGYYCDRKKDGCGKSIKEEEVLIHIIDPATGEVSKEEIPF